MQYPDRFADLPAYAFPRLRALLDAHAPGAAPVDMSIGAPKHPFPDWVSGVIAAHAAEFQPYPPNEGTPELLEAICAWLERRYGVAMAPENLMALNGTREGLYNVAAALCPERKAGARPAVLIPNPFYQVYAVAALSVGAEPVYVPATAETGFLPDYTALPANLLERTALAYLCSPSNPQGAVADASYWRALLALAERHDFKIVADECYSEIYRDAPPPGALEVAAQVGADPERVVAFHSLSKRSNLPGLRSGFVASGRENIARIRTLRNYAGAPLPLPLQRAATALWADETHVADNRRLYAEKFASADAVFEGVPEVATPRAGFFLWLPVEDGEAAALTLWRERGVRVLPGAYLGRDAGDGNPGHGYIRAALVGPAEETRRGLAAIRDCLYRGG